MMDLVTINDYDWIGDSTSQSWIPDKLIEAYDSLIWTERYNELGDFEIHSYDIGRMLRDLPPWKLISLSDTDVVMRIEDHEIDKDADGNEFIKITGRAIESIFEGRFMNFASDSTGPSDMGSDFIGVEGLWQYLIWAHDNLTDPLVGGGIYGGYMAGTIVTADPSLTVRSDLTRFWQQGDAWTPIHNLLLQMNMGFRSIRRRFTPNMVNHVELYAPLGVNTYTLTPVENTPWMCFDVYQGINHSSKDDADVVVSFDVLNGNLQDTKYLMSRKNFYTGITVYENGGPLNYTRWVPGWDPNDSLLGPTSSGLNYRKKAVDGGSRGSLTGPQMTTYLHQLCNIEIAKVMNTMAVDFAVKQTPTTPRYGLDYGLGDLVDLRLDYGIIKQGRVTEYIRSKDANGEIGYPTIVVTDPT